MRLLLFDWTSGGHHDRYVRRFADALSAAAGVVVAVPHDMADTVDDLPVEVVPLESSRPRTDCTRRLAPQHRELARAELDLFERVASRVRPDHLIHLYADPVIRRLVERPPLNVPITLCLFFARAHYPSAYRSPLGPRELLRAWFQEALVARWRRRPDAHALFTLDEEAARRWSRRKGAPVFWLPEPPIGSLPPMLPVEERSGCVVYGALARRKGIDRLARAVALEPISLRVVLAGAVEAGFERELASHVAEMERAGATVELRAYQHDEREGLEVLATARCAVLPYPRHYTASRVLLEACAVGTPVIVNDFGLLGHLVHKHRLGIAIECSNPRTLRQALLTLVENSVSGGDYTDALNRFVARYSRERFREAVTVPYRTPLDTSMRRIGLSTLPLLPREERS